MNQPLTVYTLWQREIVRFLRQPNRVAGAILSPLLFWFLLGSGVGRSFQPDGWTGDANYFQYVFPGTLLMILLFTAIFSTISIIEDRKEGFLQSVLVAPVPRGAIVLGKMAGGTTLAVLQAVLFLFLAPVVGFPFQLGPWLALVGVLFVLGLALTGLGFLIAWRMSSVQGFHAVMNFVLLPLWLLSGALFPVEGASGWMQWLIRLNPLSYGLAAVRRLLHEGAPPSDLPPLGWSVLISVAFALVLFAAASFVARGTVEEDLQ